MSELADISGLSIRHAEPANVIVEYVPSGCSGEARGFRGRVRISTSSRRATVHCIHEELAQLIGPADDACHYRPSIFCDSDFLEDYAPADKIILRATFDPRLRVGMTREEGMPIARVVIRELYEQEFGPIREAEQEADTRRAEPDDISLP